MDQKAGAKGRKAVKKIVDAALEAGTLVLVEDADGKRRAQIVVADCVGCGLCPQLCREEAISQSGWAAG